MTYHLVAKNAAQSIKAVVIYHKETSPHQIYSSHFDAPPRGIWNRAQKNAKNA